MGLSWGDLNPLSWPGQVRRRLEKDFGSTSSQKEQEARLREQGEKAGHFAGEGEAGYGRMTAAMEHDRDALRALAAGKHSIAAEQLRQGLQQQYAQQQSAAAGASPQNSVMAARNAMMNMGRAATGMAGNAALAGLQERRDAQEMLARLNLGQREQDLQAALESRRNAISGYGGYTPQQSIGQKILSGAGYGLAKFSDRRLKTDVKDADRRALEALAKLGSYSYRYKDPKHGKGEQLGVLAQELRDAGLKHIVRDAPEGLQVDGAGAATTSLAMVAALGRKVAELEGAERKNAHDTGVRSALRRFAEGGKR